MRYLHKAGRCRISNIVGGSNCGVQRRNRGVCRSCDVLKNERIGAGRYNAGCVVDAYRGGRIEIKNLTGSACIGQVNLKLYVIGSGGTVGKRVPTSGGSKGYARTEDYDQEEQQMHKRTNEHVAG